MIAGAQARRGLALWKALEGQATVESADGWRRRDGAVELSVSPPLPHGVDGTPLGHVVGLAVCDLVQRERFVFASDVQGPLSAVAAAWLIQQRPTLLYLSGPPSYVERDLPAGGGPPRHHQPPRRRERAGLPRHPRPHPPARPRRGSALLG